MLVKRNIRRKLQNIPEKNTKEVLEDIILILEELDGEKTHLATKDDIKQVIEMMNARFELVMKENMALRQEMNARFEAMEKRFEAMEKANAARFELVMKENMALRQEMNARFEAVNQRFEAMEKANVARFETINQRFESLEKILAFMQWLIGGGVLLVALKLFFPHIFPQ